MHEKLWCHQKLLPPKKYTELCKRFFDWLDADSTNLAIRDQEDVVEEDDENDEEDENVGWPPHCEVEVLMSPELAGKDAAEAWDLWGRPAGDWVFKDTHMGRDPTADNMQVADDGAASAGGRC